MPNKFTEHFNLNQWEKTDKVLMEDFNADNAKLDAAFLNHRSAELIDSVALEVDGDVNIQFDISQLDWSRYMALAIMADTSGPNGFLIRTNNSRERCVYMYQNNAYPRIANYLAYQPYSSHMAAILPVFYDGSHAISVISFGSGVNESDTTVTYPSFSAGGGMTPMEQSTFIRIGRHQSSYLTGDRFFLWGVK